MKRFASMASLIVIFLSCMLLAPFNGTAIGQQTQAQQRPADIVSPTTTEPVPPVTAAAEAHKLGRYVYDRPTPKNSILFLIDHQVGLMSGARDYTSLAEYKNNVVALGRFAKTFAIPVLLTTSNAQWQNGDLLPELKALFPNEPIYRRTGIINAYEDPTVRKTLQELVTKTGRDHIIIAGVTIGTCTAFPTLSLLQDGYKVFPVVDATGAWSRYEAEAAMSRMARAGAELVSVFSLLAELQYDWKRPTAEAAGAIFHDHLPEYGLTMDNFWSNANQKVVPDPFGVVKSPK